jgi:hypothetical protein
MTTTGVLKGYSYPPQAMETINELETLLLHIEEIEVDKTKK